MPEHDELLDYVQRSRLDDEPRQLPNQYVRYERNCDVPYLHDIKMPLLTDAEVDEVLTELRKDHGQ